VITLHEASGGVSFAIKVHPRAKRDAITGNVGDALKISVTSPPVEGRANQACVIFLAKILQVPKASVHIVSGESTRTKVVRIDGITAAELRLRLRELDEKSTPQP
jgi:uncharacterized protein